VDVLDADEQRDVGPRASILAQHAVADAGMPLAQGLEGGADGGRGSGKDHP
jgi:hypothetical protein